jgi:hypothetical protein
MARTQKAKLFGGSIQAGSLCYFALRTGARGMESSCNRLFVPASNRDGVR